MRIAMAQTNPTIGDLKGNCERIQAFIAEAAGKEAELVAFPELAITGYPPQDLVLEQAFIRKNKDSLKQLIAQNKADITVVVGFIDYEADRLFNAAAVFSRDRLLAVVHKTLLPTYDVFDEDRYFRAQKPEDIRPTPLSGGTGEPNLGVEICEDLWDEHYDTKVTDLLVQRGARFVINISASPFHADKRLDRLKVLKEKSSRNRIPIFYVNLVGGQDELVFDGESLAVDKAGRLIAAGRQFQEDLIITDLDIEKGLAKRAKLPEPKKERQVFNAIVLGIRDYFRKTGFRKAVIGMSGGIDSSLTTCIAVEALGKENVIGLYMPTKYSTGHSLEDSEKLATNLQICFVKFPIEAILSSYQQVLKVPLKRIRDWFEISETGDDPIADENIQPRVRGNCLMDVSNRLAQLGILVINTGNKTELALGYCTLYGDMTGGIGALGDVSKLEVYRLAGYVNQKAGREVIPTRVFEKKPSPELKEGQTDPFDFDIVSPLVDEIVENRRSKQQLISMGYPREVVEDTYARIRRAEYKRWQAPPCIKVTPKAFGIGWKMPIVNKYQG
jgi:NAD+ synthase (glutamine-hydrolysing)